MIKESTQKLLEKVIEETQLMIPLINFRKDVLERNCLVIKDPTVTNDAERDNNSFLKFRYYLERNNTTVVTDILGNALVVATRDSSTCDLSAFPIKELSDDTAIYGNVDTLILPATCVYIPDYLLKSDRLKIQYAGFELPAYLQKYEDRIELVQNPFIRIGTKMDSKTAKVDITLLGEFGLKPELVDEWISKAKILNVDEEIFIAQNMSMLEGYYGYGTLYRHLEYEYINSNLNILEAKSIVVYDYSASEFFRKDLKYSELKTVFE